MSTVSLPAGRTASYEAIGQGEPLLMFMGGPGLAAEFLRDDAELLAETFRTFLIDPHGSGGSSPPADPSQYDHLGHAGFYDEVRQALGLEHVSVHGVSFGGTVALTYASQYPQRTVRCLAVSGFGLGGEADEAAGGAAAAEMEQMLARHADQPWYPSARAAWDGWTERVLASDGPAELERMFREVLPLYCAHPERPDVAAGLARLRDRVRVDAAALKAWEGGIFQTIDLRPLLPSIACPTLVLCGELDLICGPAQGRPIAAAVAGAQLVVMPDSGHFMSVECPAEYRDAMLEFSGRTSAGATA
jgi:pimeloyl-ACP methyl ester carboxylesterase